MPGPGIPMVVMGAYIADDGTTHQVPSYIDEKDSKVTKPMSGHRFTGYCCYKEPVRQPDGKIHVVHTIIH